MRRLRVSAPCSRNGLELSALGRPPSLFSHQVINHTFMMYVILWILEPTVERNDLMKLNFRRDTRVHVICKGDSQSSDVPYLVCSLA